MIENVPEVAVASGFTRTEEKSFSWACLSLSLSLSLSLALSAFHTFDDQVYQSSDLLSSQTFSHLSIQISKLCDKLQMFPNQYHTSACCFKLLWKPENSIFHSPLYKKLGNNIIAQLFFYKVDLYIRFIGRNRVWL